MQILKTNNMTKKDYNPIKEFDEQIKSELRYNKNDIKKCPSYWAKKLFIETEYFNHYNWNIIQTDDYLLERDYYQRIINNLKYDFFKKQEILTNQYKFMYETVLEHKKRLVNINGEMYYDIS